FSTEGGELLLTDFMPAMAEDERRRTMRPQCELVRLLQCSRGEVELDVVFDARPGYALERCAVVSRGALGLRMRCRAGLLSLRAWIPLEPSGSGARGRIRLRAGERAELSLSLSTSGVAVLPPLGERSEAALDSTLRFWQGWSARTTYRGPYRDAVVRSALA